MPASDTSPVSQADVALVRDAVSEAGALAMTLFRQRLRGWNKRDGSPVSEADIAVDTLLKERLLGPRQGYGWLSEETPDNVDRLTRTHVWIADPIDGTRAFLKGESEWCVAVALAVGGRLAAAAVYRPVTEEFYLAALGEGASLNGGALRAPEVSGLLGARVIGSKTALKPLMDAGIDADTRSEIPLILRFCGIAGGRSDAALAIVNKNDWDLAAGHLVLAEAGGTITDAKGSDLVYNRRDPWQAGFVAATPQLHAEIMRRLGGS